MSSLGHRSRPAVYLIFLCLGQAPQLLLVDSHLTVGLQQVYHNEAFKNVFLPWVVCLHHWNVWGSPLFLNSACWPFIGERFAFCVQLSVSVVVVVVGGVLHVALMQLYQGCMLEKWFPLQYNGGLCQSLLFLERGPHPPCALCAATLLPPPPLIRTAASPL